MSGNNNIIKEKTKFESEWRDRLLLESLVSQILPDLIISAPDKVDEILEFLKEDAVTLQDFYEHFPEHRNLEIKNSLDIKQRFSLRGGDDQEDFFPIVNFNHSLFQYLTEIIAERNILAPKEDGSYRIQLRLSLYNNFNRYLNRLLAALSPIEAETACLALANAADYKVFLNILAKSIRISEAEIINNFFNPFN